MERVRCPMINLTVCSRTPVRGDAARSIRIGGTASNLPRSWTARRVFREHIMDSSGQQFPTDSPPASQGAVGPQTPGEGPEIGDFREDFLFYRAKRPPERRRGMIFGDCADEEAPSRGFWGPRTGLYGAFSSSRLTGNRPTAGRRPPARGPQCVPADKPGCQRLRPTHSEPSRSAAPRTTGSPGSAFG
jgi:hypothetical protein